MKPSLKPSLIQVFQTTLGDSEEVTITMKRTEYERMLKYVKREERHVEYQRDRSRKQKETLNNLKKLVEDANLQIA